MHKKNGMSLSLLILLGAGFMLRAETLWIEGESATIRQNQPHRWWYDQVKNEVLSGGAWISHFSEDGPGQVGYELTLTEAGAYTLWIRANPVQTHLDLRVDGGDWREIPLEPNRESINIAADNKPDLRFIAWVNAGTLDLDPGLRRLEFRFRDGPQNHGAIDVFCLTSDGLIPVGAGQDTADSSIRGDPAPLSDAVWIEGEAASRKDVQPHGWYNQVKTDVLSGETWLSHFSGEGPGTAEYDFEIETADTYTFWLRANPEKSELAYRLDDGSWIPVDFSRDVRGRINIAADNKPDLRFIAWVRVGQVDLAAGRHRLTFRMEGALSNHGAIDCFTLVRIPFVPSGAHRPSVARAEAGPADWFPVLFGDDPFSEESVTDVSHLVAAPAGKMGFLKADGAHLRFERAREPIRFWAVGANLGRKTPEDMTRTARWFRRHGINLVRQHPVIGDIGLPDQDGRFDPAKLDRYDRWFAELKKQGLYTAWSVIYPHHGPLLRHSDPYPTERFAELDALDEHRDGTRQPIVVNDYINLDRSLQDYTLGFFKTLLEHVNPYTGQAYRDDPALAVVEFQNESNLFFHTLNRLAQGQPERFAGEMQEKFYAFVIKKYGSQEKATQAWVGRSQAQDDWDQGRLALMGAYHWGSEGPLHEYQGQTRRTGDYLEFLTRLQRGYYERRQLELRDLGFKGVTVTTAWRSGGPAASMANLYCDTAADMIDRHDYAGGGAGGHAITEGQVSTMTHLDQPGHGLLSMGLFQVANQPFGSSEWSMMPPAPYKAEAAPLVAFYGLGLQGWDASYHFSCGAVRMGNGWPNLGKYVSHTPHYMGQFPALALAVHQRHLREAKPIAVRSVSREQLFSGVDPLGQALSGGGHDDKQLVGRPVTPPEALAIGKILVRFDGGTEQANSLDAYWDRDKQILRSTTGELVWRYGNRRVEVGAPKTQAIIGFTGSDPIRLPAVIAEIKTPYVSLLFTALDNRNMVDSRHILVTAMARDKQTGTRYNGDGSQLLTVGGPPLLMEPVQARIRLAGARPVSIRVLDVYGVPTERTVPVQPDGSFTLDGTYRSYYYDIRR